MVNSEILNSEKYSECIEVTLTKYIHLVFLPDSIVRKRRIEPNKLRDIACTVRTPVVARPRTQVQWHGCAHFFFFFFSSSSVEEHPIWIRFSSQLSTNITLDHEKQVYTLVRSRFSSLKTRFSVEGDPASSAPPGGPCGGGLFPVF